jgi:hypothetical protein
MNTETNFILFHKGPIPEYINTCINQIHRTQTNYKIYLLIESQYSLNINSAAKIIPIEYLQPIEISNISYYLNDQNPLWRTSLERFFYIKNFINDNNINNVIHFDNDVLIYQDVDTIKDILKTNIPNIGITPHKANELVCGFMYINNPDSLNKLCEHLLRLAVLGEFQLNAQLGSMPHEMRLLGEVKNTQPGIITELPVSPISPGDNLFDKFNIVFDPSSYGQYIGGTHANGGGDRFENHLRSRHRYIDMYIDIKYLPSFDMLLKAPFLSYEGQQIPIFNLHIHSKQLHLYI